MMSKKKQKIELNSSPLESVTIGQIKDNKFGFIKVIILFALFIAIIYFLPEINNLYQSFLGSSSAPSSVNRTINNNTTNNVTKEKDEDEEKTVELKYNFDEITSVTVNGLNFNDIRITDEELSYTIENKENNAINLDILELFFEVYDKDSNLIRRYAVTGNVDGNSSKIFNFNYDFSNASYYQIKYITQNDYPYVLLDVDDRNTSVLTCEKGNSKIIYTFIDDKLNKIEHVDEFLKEDENYDIMYTFYNELYVKNRSNDGITTTFTTSSKSFKYKMVVDYTKASSKIDNKLYFSKDEKPNIVNFIVESMEYDCK